MRHIWLLGLTALAIHGMLDPLVSYLAISIFDIASEANPLMAPHFQGGIGRLFLIHIPLIILTIIGLWCLTWLFSVGTGSQKRKLYRLSVGLWALIILWGLVVVANNLFVLFEGIS
jgi:hypothetical protein